MLPGGFSLLNQLDLDLDIDEDMVFEPTVPEVVAAPKFAEPTAPVQAPATSKFDPKQPMFFNIPKKPVQPFHRTATDEEIRKRWEDTKVELTTGWKKRWREASKSTRRGRVLTGED
jgi:hypothetical protein